MDCFSATRDSFNLFLSDAEAQQHRLAKLQLELENKERELKNFEATVRQRERDVAEAEAAATKAKLDRAAAIKRSVLSPTVKREVTNDRFVKWLMDSHLPIKVVPKTPYDEMMVKSIREKGLIMSTDFRHRSQWKTTLQVTRTTPAGSEVIEIDVAVPQNDGLNGGHVTMILVPIDADWNFFKVTAFTVKEQYPMPLAAFRRVPITKKPAVSSSIPAKPL